MFQGDIYRAKEAVSGTSRTLRGVYVESPWSGWAIGDGGTVLRWDGVRWSPVALASKVSALTCIWGHPTDGIWIGGKRFLLSRHPVHGSTLYEADADVRCVWGSGSDDVWFLCAGRLVLHWTGEKCERIDLPGDDDEEWNAVAGADGIVYIVGVSGFMLRYDGQRWEEIATDETALITGAVCDGRDLFVCTDNGLVRQWDGRRWHTIAFSAFGPLRSICMVDGILWAAGDRGVVIQHRPDDGSDKE